MKSNLRAFVILLVVGLLSLGMLVSYSTAPALQEITPTPTGKPGMVPPTIQVGTTNGITLLGILIFAVIVMAVAVHLKEMRASQG
jgi:hypothetical protein